MPAEQRRPSVCKFTTNQEGKDKGVRCGCPKRRLMLPILKIELRFSSSVIFDRPRIASSIRWTIFPRSPAVPNHRSWQFLLFAGHADSLGHPSQQMNRIAPEGHVVL